MFFKQMVDTLLNEMDMFFGRMFDQYFSGEWIVPWLPDDL